MKPQRIQRRRAKGWRMPPNTRYVGRPGKYGNPFSVGRPVPDDFFGIIDHNDLQTYIIRNADVPDAAEAVRLYEKYFPFPGTPYELTQADLAATFAALQRKVAELERKLAEVESRIPEQRLYAADIQERYGLRTRQAASNKMSRGEIPVRRDGGKNYCLRSELDAFEAWAADRARQRKTATVPEWEAGKKVGEKVAKVRKKIQF